jgi:hypothetical protein
MSVPMQWLMGERYLQQSNRPGNNNKNVDINISALDAFLE